MKKHLLCWLLLPCSIFLYAQTDALEKLLPLLQAPVRTNTQNQQVLNLFLSAKQPEVIFSAGASLVRIPPALAQEPKLLNVIIKNSDSLKQVFSAVILTAMGTNHEELSDLLQEATASADPAVRAYAAAAYTILHPDTNQYVNDIIRLYIYDPAFAQRAMNLLCANEKQTLTYLKAAAACEQAPVRAAAAAWLGDLQTPQAAKQLLKMAKKETDTEARNALAVALAKNRPDTLQAVTAGLKTAYTAPAATTYTLALGFMTGYAVEPIKQSLTDKEVNVRINAARAAAYMAGVLASEQAAHYSTDPAFDAQLAKGLIPLLSTVARTDKPAQPYAENALKQLVKLK